MDTLIDTMELVDLHDLLADSRKGYLEAGNTTKQHAIAAYLLQLSEEREQMRSALQALMEELPQTGHLIGEVNSGAGLDAAWIDIREELTKAHDTDMLMACEHAESYIFSTYDAMIKAARQPRDVQALLMQQRLQVQASLYALERSNSAMHLDVRYGGAPALARNEAAYVSAAFAN